MFWKRRPPPMRSTFPLTKQLDKCRSSGHQTPYLDTSHLTPAHHVPFFLLAAYLTCPPAPTSDKPRAKATVPTPLPPQKKSELHQTTTASISSIPPEDFFLSPTDIPKESSVLLSSSDSSSPSSAPLTLQLFFSLLTCFASLFSLSSPPAPSCFFLLPAEHQLRACASCPRAKKNAGGEAVRPPASCARRSRRTRKGSVLERKGSRRPPNSPWVRWVPTALCKMKIRFLG